MGLFDSISKLFVDPVDTSGATNALNNASQSARNQLQPNVEASSDIRNALLTLFGDQGAFQGTDAFRFGLDQGVAARDKSAAARGQLGSGNFQKELTQFGTGLANQDRRNEINSLLSFFSQTNPANAQVADIDLNKGKNLASISLGAENARVNSSNSLLDAAFGLGGRALGRVNFGDNGFSFGSG